MDEFSDVLLDSDGVPYPREVQVMWEYVNECTDNPTVEFFTEALEAVARQAWKQARR